MAGNVRTLLAACKAIAGNLNGDGSVNIASRLNGVSVRFLGG